MDEKLQNYINEINIVNKDIKNIFSKEKKAISHNMFIKNISKINDKNILSCFMNNYIYDKNSVNIQYNGYIEHKDLHKYYQRQKNILYF
jgi:hypothetical protein